MRRQLNDCPTGGNWYKCGVEFGGFSGCCLVDPCYQGGGCPKEKDLTPGRYISTFTTGSSRGSSVLLSSAGPSVTVSSTTLPLSQPLSSIAPTTSTRDDIRPTAYITIDQQPSATPSEAFGSTQQGSLPLAAIIGAAVGAVVLACIAISLLLRRRAWKRKNIYQAPIYVSPYNTSSDGSQESGPEYHQKSWENSQVLQQSARSGHRSAVIISPLAELPGESVTRSY